MGHHVQTFIGPRAALIALAANDQLARVVDLPNALSVLPVTVAWASAHSSNRGASTQGFFRLTEAFASRARAASHIAPIAYIETEYFGGVGDQIAIAWSRGEVIATGCVNDALAAIGVKRGLLRDEWDAIGLTNYRENARFFERAGIPVPDSEDERD